MNFIARICTLTYLILYTVSLVQAQDTIVKRNNEKIICKIKEITEDEIKYTVPSSTNDIIYGIDKNEVANIYLSNGTKMSFSNLMYNPENYSSQKKNLLKIQIMTPLYGYTAFSYERSLKPGSSIEGTIGLIGFGTDIILKGNGVSFKLGYKFIESPDFYLKGMRYAHILKGSYVRPEICFSVYNRSGSIRNAGAILINIGKQWVFDNLFAVDIFGGIGYGFSSNNVFNLQYGFTTGGSSFPIALSSGFRIGLLF